jgi:hypothetical protein
MNLQEAQHKLSADISQLYETYQLISKSKQQFNELDVALLQQQLLYVYHSLLKVQGQLAHLPPGTVNVEEVLPMAGLTSELVVQQPILVEPEVVMESMVEPMVAAAPEPQPVMENVVEEPVKAEAPTTNELKFEFTPNTITETEPTLDDLEKLMQAQELAEEQAKLNDELEAFEVQTTLPLEPTKPLNNEVTPVAEVSLLDKLSAAMRTPDVVEKIARDQQQSLKQAINLNKKIAFVNNLFNENTVEYAKAIEKLNASSTLHEALRYFNELKHQYSWSNENSLVKELELLIEKRYS